MSDSEDPIDPSEVEEDGDDLFGDDAGAQASSPKARVLDDDELASDPDEDTQARYRGGYEDDDDQMAPETRDRVVMAVQTYRHRIPRPKDDSLRVMRVPKFVKFLPELYNADTFEPSEWDFENARAAQPKHVTRVSRDAETDELKSNTNVFRWSDGSVTISIGGEQYEVQKKGLAPQPGQKYEAVQDGHYYAAAAELRSNLLVTVGHVTEQYNIRPPAPRTAGESLQWWL
jgi:RNA polymerase-associated protein LEO1